MPLVLYTSIDDASPLLCTSASGILWNSRTICNWFFSVGRITRKVGVFVLLCYNRMIAYLFSLISGHWIIILTYVGPPIHDSSTYLQLCWSLWILVFAVYWGAKVSIPTTSVCLDAGNLIIHWTSSWKWEVEAARYNPYKPRMPHTVHYIFIINPLPKYHLMYLFIRLMVIFCVRSQCSCNYWVYFITSPLIL